MLQSTVVHLCPHCLNSERAEGRCSVCGTSVVRCETGPPGDPSRRPLIDDQGRVRSRAPLWWLRTRVGKLTRYLD